MFSGEDTIAAVATGMGNAGIGIIRVSGDQAIFAVDRIFRGRISLCDLESHSLLYGHIVDQEEIIDEVLVTVFVAPRSYTREDVVEISSHGGAIVMQRILNLVLSQNIRLAEPGEFTKRAFLNGRIDLAQAESVMDIIASDNEQMLSNSLRQLDGELSEEIRNLRERILHETAFIEAALDDPEHYDLEDYAPHLLECVKDWRSEISSLLASSKQGRILRNGIRTVIVGKPNAGKSSLLNALAKSERAIVTEIPGTTRDTIEEKVRFEDMVLVLIDTAGIRDTDNLVEQIGVERSLSALESADMILFVMDISQPLSDEDVAIIQRLNFEKTIPLFNKVDLIEALGNGSSEILSTYQQFLVDHALPMDWIDRGVFLSAKQRRGFAELATEIKCRLQLDIVDKSVDILITSERHAKLLRDADVSMSHVENSISCGLPEDFYTVDLMEAYTALGSILGEEVEDDLVDKVFRDFCMGK
ncbi:MAG: tRNA uridine-5-carboxymethylaminomethyl(34) synthesis GTPase MnmE [Lachnospiraceae bacterium]|nr:tRNA uridine-5-carboxymethylaminomethyl(34) synthesis GTPase MnmE [Lachnospiraceae bacterium]